MGVNWVTILIRKQCYLHGWVKIAAPARFHSAFPQHATSLQPQFSQGLKVYS
jgi:hypothetical protein